MMVVCAVMLATLSQTDGSYADECARCQELTRRVLSCPQLPEIGQTQATFRDNEGSPLGAQVSVNFENPNSGYHGELTIEHAEHISMQLRSERSPWDHQFQTLPWPRLCNEAEEIAHFLMGGGNGMASDTPALYAAEQVDREGIISFEFRDHRTVEGIVFWSACFIRVGISVDYGSLMRIIARFASGDPSLNSVPRANTIEAGIREAAGALQVKPERLTCYEAQYDYLATRNSESKRPIWQMAVIVTESGAVAPAEKWAIVRLSQNAVVDVQTRVLPKEYRETTTLAELDRSSREGRIDRSLGPKPTINDRWPVWTTTGDDILFISGRSRRGAPWWRPADSVMKTDAESSELVCVHAVLQVILDEISSEGNLLLARNARRHELQLVRLADGHRLLKGRHPELHFDAPSLSRDGRAVVYSADRRHGDMDIFVDEIDEDLSGLHRHRRLCRLDGQDHHPVFLGDGARVCFAHVGHATHEHDEEGLATTSLHVVGAAKPYWENDPPEEVVGGFVNVHRLSVFPDGTRVLVADDRGLWIVDVDAATSTALNIPDLHDPELPNGPPLTVRQPAVSPDGTRLAFSGYRDAGEGADGTGWYIYVCDLDGSNLRRVTPLEDDPVPPYVFPETGKTAFDVAREIALQRMNADG
jgi:Tol biopolymer transport system component